MFLGTSQNVPYIIWRNRNWRNGWRIKKKYYDNQNKLSLSDQMIWAKELELEKKMVEYYVIQDEIRECIDKLKKESLYPIANETAEEYIDLQIESERTEKKEGYKDWIKSFESTK